MEHGRLAGFREQCDDGVAAWFGAKVWRLPRYEAASLLGHLDGNEVGAVGKWMPSRPAATNNLTT